MNFIDLNIKPIDPARVRKFTLPDGSFMPQAAMGTFHSDNPDLMTGMEDIIVEAIRLGYRHLDCATAYQNEEVVGRAIAKAIKLGYVMREELFVLTKLWNKDMAPKDVRKACETSLEKLGLDYVDMYLVHWPWPNYHEPGAKKGSVNPHAVPYIHEMFMPVWDEMCKLKKAGLVKNIGTSNQTRKTMELLLRDAPADYRPVYNQMELHPLFQQKELVKYLISQNIIPYGYMSLGSPRRPGRDRFPEHQADMQNFIIQKIAKETGLTPPQICLSWAHQRENYGVGYVSMAERSEWIKANLETATVDLLSKANFELIDGDGTEDNPGINSNNRLIWGQVFLWPEAKLFTHERYALWDDCQVFETFSDYERFKKAVSSFYSEWKNCVVDLPVSY